MALLVPDKGYFTLCQVEQRCSDHTEIWHKRTIVRNQPYKATHFGYISGRGPIQDSRYLGRIRFHALATNDMAKNTTRLWKNLPLEGRSFRPAVRKRSRTKPRRLTCSSKLFELTIISSTKTRQPELTATALLHL